MFIPIWFAAKPIPVLHSVNVLSKSTAIASPSFTDSHGSHTSLSIEGSYLLTFSVILGELITGRPPLLYIGL